MSIRDMTRDRDSYHGFVDESATHEPLMVLLKSIVDKLDEISGETNNHDTDLGKRTLSGIDNIEFEVDSRFSSLYIKVTVGSTTKKATLSLR